MWQRPLLRRALARAEQFLRPGHLAAPPAPAPPPPTPPSAVTATDVPDPDPPAAADPAAMPAAPAPLEPHHQQGLALARAHRWNWAQRELELAVRAMPQGPAGEDLASVRAVRRQLRVLQKWPRDAQAHLTLGRSYFELGLGEDAEQAFRQASALAPQEPAAYVFLALEYAYRGASAEGERAYAQAQALGADLPPYASVLAECQRT